MNARFYKYVVLEQPFGLSFVYPCSMQNLVAAYRALINGVLPQTFTYPVRSNHCFARIVLDWLFQDCWYKHLPQSAPAYKQLNKVQLEAAIARMRQWMQNPHLLVQDNNASLGYRRTLRKQQGSA